MSSRATGAKAGVAKSTARKTTAPKTTAVKSTARKASPRGAAAAAATKASAAPTLDIERSFLAPGVRLLAGVDEVGRGAFAGPVSVGIAVVDLQEQSLLDGVRDSKLLKAEDRERLEPLVRGWAVAAAVGHASAAEIDGLGIIAALRLAGNKVAAAFRLPGDKIAGALWAGILRAACGLRKRGGARQQPGGNNN